MYRSRWVALYLVVLFALIGCSETVKPLPAQEFDLLRDAQPVPPLIAQLQSLDRALENGLSLQSVSNLHMATLTVEDFYGNPFVHVTVTSPIPINELWAFAATLSGDEWEGDTEGSPWNIAITGASTASYPQSMNGVGLETLIDFRDTITAMGGSKKLKRVVAAMSTIFLLQDVSGTYWDPNNRAPVNDELFFFLKNNYDEMVSVNNSPELQEQLAALWEPYLDPASQTVAVLHPALHPDLASVSGNLNLKRAAELLREREKFAPQVRRTPKVVCEYILGLAVCYDLLHGYINPWHQAHSGAFDQYPYFFGWQSTHVFKVPRCAPLGGVVQDALLGCGPASFISLIWRLWANGEPFYQKNITASHMAKTVRSFGLTALVSGTHPA
jgi:hypothetical protein